MDRGLVSDGLARHLVSIDGAAGMARLLDRIEPHLAGLSAAWEARDFLAPALALDECAKASDAADLRASDFKLRVDCVGTANEHATNLFDTYVRSKIYEALLEVLAGADENAIYEAVETITNLFDKTEPRIVDSLLPSDLGYIMRLLLVRLQLRRGMATEAVATAKRNLAANSACPHTTRYLYYALTQQKATGRLTESPGVALQDLSDRFCSQPFDTLASTAQARQQKSGLPVLYACQCPGMLIYRVSDGTETQGINDIWNGSAIQEIRRSILDGDFTYCSRHYCSDILSGTLPKKNEIVDTRLRDIIDNHKVVSDGAPLTLSLAHDPSCNLACPSCRTSVYSVKNEQREALDRFSERILLPLMEDAPVSLILSADGDPFGSKHYRNLMRNLDPVRHSKVRLTLLTNGLLLTEREWDELTNIHAMVAAVSVSIDAAEADAYEYLRRPGKWSVLTPNLDNLSRLRRESKVPYVSLNFVVQQKNYRQMPAFVEMTRAWGFDRALFLKLVNIGSFTSDQLRENDVCNPLHPEYEDFLAVLRDPIMRWREAELFNVKPYLEIAETAGRIAASARESGRGVFAKIIQRLRVAGNALH